MAGSAARASEGQRHRARFVADDAPGDALAAPLDPSSRLALHRQIEARIRASVADGRLRPGTRLPGSRTLARELGVARITVATAYEQLVAEGYLEASSRSSTRVAAALPESGLGWPVLDSSPARELVPTPVPNAWAAMMPITMADEPTDEAFDLGPESFTLAALDVRSWERRLVAAWRELVAEDNGGAVSYFGGLGDEVLRRALADHLTLHRGVRARPDTIAITAGAAAALSAIARTWLGPGRRCVVEDPGGAQLRRSLSSAGAELVPVAVDEAGLDPALLPDHADVAFVTPGWQYPHGGRLSLARRLALLDWARRTGCLIVEDDCEGELRYAGDPLPTLQGLAEDGRVIYVNTFSKVLFPGLRTGYLVVPDAHRGALLAALEAGARPPAALEQRALGRFVEDGAYQRHLRRLRGTYAARRAMLEHVLRERVPDRLRVRPGEAGGHAVVDILDPRWTGTSLVAAAASAGVRIEALRANRLNRDGTDRSVVVYLTRTEEPGVALAAARLADVVSGRPGGVAARAPGADRGPFAADAER